MPQVDNCYLSLILFSQNPQFPKSIPGQPHVVFDLKITTDRDTWRIERH